MVLVILCAFHSTALADLGMPDFQDWYVVCGLDGWDFDDEAYDNRADTYVTVRDHLEPGTRLMVYSYYEPTKTYHLVADDKNYTPKGKGFVYVTEEELEKNFFEYKETVPAEKGQKLDEDVICVVTSDDGVVLRQGPARTFPSYCTVPYEAEIVYRYTYSYGGYNWGYTTYKGQTGWMCIDYTKKVEKDVAPVTETTPASTEPTPEPASQETVPSDEPSNPSTDVIVPDTVQTENVTTQVEQNDSGSGLMSETSYIILICALCAVVLALSATIILMIIKRKKSQ